MKQVLTGTALGIAVLAGGWAVSAEARDGHRERPSFEELDANGDGQITQDELTAKGNARFADADANGDGSLSRDELLAGMSKRGEKRIDRMMSHLDKDEDGLLSQEELQSGRRGDRAQKMFERVDADGDGAISQEEYAEMKPRGKRAKKKSDE